MAESACKFDDIQISCFSTRPTINPLIKFIDLIFTTNNDNEFIVALIINIISNIN